MSLRAGVTSVRACVCSSQRTREEQRGGGKGGKRHLATQVRSRVGVRAMAAGSVGRECKDGKA